MEIRERIESCLNNLDERRRQMAEFEMKVRTLMETLRTEGGTRTSMAEVIEVLGDVLTNYSEIDLNCREMISALQEIGRNQDRIEEGRRKIVGGVEKILGHLTKMEVLARQSLGSRAPSEPARAGEAAGGEEPPRKRKKILLIRVRPQEGGSAEELAERIERIRAGVSRSSELETDPLDEALSEDDGPDTVVH